MQSFLPWPTIDFKALCTLKKPTYKSLTGILRSHSVGPFVKSLNNIKKAPHIVFSPSILFKWPTMINNFQNTQIKKI